MMMMMIRAATQNSSKARVEDSRTSLAKMLP
jgi:hypothetical protein